MTETETEAIELVRRFLSAIEHRDAASAAACIHPQAQMIFPGGRRHGSIDEMFAASARRYAFVGKRFERIEAYERDDAVVVYCMGTLHGTFANATAFSDIRFIDRFEVDAGRIRRQEVWNDVRYDETTAASPESLAARAGEVSEGG